MSSAFELIYDTPNGHIDEINPTELVEHADSFLDGRLFASVVVEMAVGAALDTAVRQYAAAIDGDYSDRRDWCGAVVDLSIRQKAVEVMLDRSLGLHMSNTEKTV